MRQTTAPTINTTIMVPPPPAEEAVLGAGVGSAVGAMLVGDIVIVGAAVGVIDGENVGAAVDGAGVGAAVDGAGVGAGEGENVSVVTPVTSASAKPRRRAHARRRRLASATTAFVKEPSLTAALSSVFTQEKRVA